jgi:hypothetical protein
MFWQPGFVMINWLSHFGLASALVKTTRGDRFIKKLTIFVKYVSELVDGLLLLACT